MSRRKPLDRQFEHVILDVVCPRDHRVGSVIKFLEPHPKAGTFATANGLRFEDRPDPTSLSGKVRGICDCGADVQVAWGRARAAIEDHQRRGKHTGILHA